MTLNESELEQILKLAGRRVKGQIHTILPGTIDSFDAATQTATARVSIASWRIDPDTNEPVAFYPEATTKAPVYFPGGAGWSLRHPIGAGDPCLLLVAERSIGEWMTTGNRSIPLDVGRRFDLTDAIVLPGLRPAADPLTDFNEDDLEIVHTAGTVLRLGSDGKVYIGNSTADLVQSLDDVFSLLNQIKLALSAFATVASGDPVATVTAGGATTLGTTLSGLTSTFSALQTKIDTLTE